METVTVRILLTHEVERLNEAAIDAGHDDVIPRERVDDLDPEGRHLVVFQMDHGDYIVAELICKMRDARFSPYRCFLAMTVEEFNGMRQWDPVEKEFVKR